MQKKQPLLLGAHMSIAGGIEKSIERGESIGCTTIQIFTKSNRQWYARPFSQEEITLFKQTYKESSIKPVVAHTSYLLNIGSPDKTVYKKSVKSFIEEMDRCHHLDIPYLVMHPGAYLNGTIEDCLQRIIDTLNELFSQYSWNTTLLFENTAGQGTNIGYTFEQLAKLYQTSKYKRKIGFCFDTCHAFAAGYTFGTEKEYKTMWKKFNDTVGLQQLKVIHMNDSKGGCGSRIDRHDHIGKGKIGLEAFKLIMNDPHFSTVPKILETPKKDTFKGDKQNMQTLTQLISEKNRKKLFINEILLKK
jgi:deoxyribonuclease-4